MKLKRIPRRAAVNLGPPAQAFRLFRIDRFADPVRSVFLFGLARPRMNPEVSGETGSQRHGAADDFRHEQVSLSSI